MIVITNVFPKLQTVNILVKPLSKKRRLRTRFDSEHVKRPKYFRNLHEGTFMTFFINLRVADFENFSSSVK